MSCSVGLLCVVRAAVSCSHWRCAPSCWKYEKGGREVVACASTKPPAPPPPRSTKEVEERPWKRGSAWANRAIAPMNQGLPRQHISCCSCALINVIYIFFCGLRPATPGDLVYLSQAGKSIHARSTARMDNPAEFVAPCWNSGLGSPTPKLTRLSHVALWIPRNPATQNCHPATPVCGTLQCQSD